MQRGAAVGITSVRPDGAMGHDSGSRSMQSTAGTAGAIPASSSLAGSLAGADSGKGRGVLTTGTDVTGGAGSQVEGRAGDGLGVVGHQVRKQRICPY